MMRTRCSRLAVLSAGWRTLLSVAGAVGACAVSDELTASKLAATRAIGRMGMTGVWSRRAIPTGVIGY